MHRLLALALDRGSLLLGLVHQLGHLARQLGPGGVDLIAQRPGLLLQLGQAVVRGLHLAFDGPDLADQLVGRGLESVGHGLLPFAPAHGQSTPT